MSRHRPRLSLLRFTVYTITLVFMLPMFLIDGRDKVKSIKIKHPDDPNPPQPQA